MPFARPTLSQLRASAVQDIATALPGTDPLLRFSNLGILGQVLAGMTHLHYGYLDYVAQQGNPFTCTGEFLEAWAALKGVYRLAAAQASGSVALNGSPGTVVPTGTPLVRGDGVAYRTTAAGTVGGGGTVTIAATAEPDPTGQTGANTNCASGTAFTLATSIAGINPGGAAVTAFLGGVDIEADEPLRARMLSAFRTRARGGSAADFLFWAQSVAGVTRAWIVPHGAGAGTVLVFFMMDQTQAANDGFPQGTNGVAALEPRAAVATGDQLAVANALFPQQPVTTMLLAMAPARFTVNYTVSGLSGASTTVRANIRAAIATVFRSKGRVASGSTTVLRSDVDAAILAVPGSSGFVVTAPTGDVTVPAGSLPVLGTITWV